MNNLIVIILGIILYLLSMIIIITTLIKTNEDQTAISVDTGTENPNCNKEFIPCVNDIDCEKCNNIEEMKCVEIERTNDQEKNME